MSRWAGAYNDNVYVFAPVDYTVTNAVVKFSKVQIEKNFTLVGDFIMSRIPFIANIGICTEK